MNNIFRKYSYILIIVTLLFWASFWYLKSGLSGLSLKNESLIGNVATASLLLICDLLVKKGNPNSEKWFNFTVIYLFINTVIIALSYFSPNSFVIAIIFVYFILLQLLACAVLLYELIHKTFLTEYSKKIQRAYLIGVPILVVLALYINSTRTW